MEIQFQKLRDDAIVPTKAHASDAGFDISTPDEVFLGVGDRAKVPLGFKMSFDSEYVVMCCSRSGLAMKHGVVVLNAPGIVDSGYRGECAVILANLGHEAVHINPGERIAQFVVVEIPKIAHIHRVLELEESDRGTGGFGSTGS